MLTRRYLVAAAFALILTLSGGQAWGQATGRIVGTVLDSTGAVVPAAKVTLVSQGTGIERTTETDASGTFVVTLVPVGIYTIRVDKPSFQQAEAKNIKLQVDENREIDFTLSLAQANTQVQVTSNPVAVNTTDATLGQVITSQQVADLPLNGRNFVQLATLGPGTVSTTDPNSFFNQSASSEVSIRGGFSLSANGSRENQTDWRLDNVDNNEVSAGGIAILPSIDAIQEFKVVTSNYSAEYGYRSGPTVLLTTKSGTNQIHGTVYEFLRNTDLNAKNFFSTTRPKFNQNQWGTSIGGPIKRDKLFYFFNYEERRLRQGLTFLAQVPTAAMRNGDFSESFPGFPAAQIYNPYSTHTDASTGQLTRDPFTCNAAGAPIKPNPNGTQTGGTPCNIIPASLINPSAQALVDFFPLPNTPGTLSTDYQSQPTEKFNDQQFTGRVDYHISEKDSLFARFSYDQAQKFQPSGLPGFGGQPGGFASTQFFDAHGRNAAISDTHVFSPTTAATVTVGFNRIGDYITSFGTGSDISTQIGIPGADTGGASTGLVDTVFSGGFWSVGDRGFAPFRSFTNVFNYLGEFDMVRGKHDIKAGMGVRFYQFNLLTANFQAGQFAFDNLWTAGFTNGVLNANSGSPIASALLGLPSQGTKNEALEGPETGRRWTVYRPYIEDDWKVTPNLTVNLGLAWNAQTPMTEVGNRFTNFNYAAAVQDGATGPNPAVNPAAFFLIAGQNASNSAGVKFDATEWEPRIGLAWSPFGSRKWAVRSGYAIYHEGGWNQGAQGLQNNLPTFGTFSFFNDNINPGTARTVSDGFDTLVENKDPASFVGTSVGLQPLNFKLGRVQQWNATVEHQLPGNILLTVAYAGERSAHLLASNFNINTAPPNTVGNNPAQLRPFPEYNSFDYFVDHGLARYDGLQFKAETKNLEHGLYFLVAYTYAKAFDNGLSDTAATPGGVVYYPLDVPHNADKGPSEITPMNYFTASTVYSLPFGRGQRFGANFHGFTQGLLGDWQVNAIARINSGFPLFISVVNNSGTALGGNRPGQNRPDRICGGGLPSGQQTVDEFFNTSCFVQPAPGVLGDSARAPLYGPDFVNFDFSAFKDFPIPLRENMKLQFRSEFFNIFNHPQFAQPGSELEAPGFGQITSTVGNPRLIQFALKFIF
jgi:Carboxypeptidase regulatory-like domain